ncbi:TonB-dependent receptor [Pseudoxanthomonas winnipegensis]|uniref:TonB-dependent receptor n=1 Tax=Pseudoxanthomonas winnipegensis TaxID=2480810 RepID=A0A4V2HER0_9GAMM|nr:TonB-dependent receptor [Pseudoxanthomonas winnipegensis]RZZ84761.1 TonB-dependent receptor [Pseudoxanthomonas winnipegensis]TAA33702.1 TonB-dependent receptor [Pseudoxanthomonas winnipegensis]
MNDSSFPKRQLLALAIAASCAAASAPGWAQQAATPAPANAAPADAPQTDASQTGAPQQATDLDKVTVTGYRYSIEQSLDQKREANAVVEVVTAEDVGKFPDKNVADALQRVPGVIITRDGGEGKNVSVRGLSSELTLTELNGNYVATAESNGDPTRSFNYTLLPANMLSSAELFKTPEARLDEGGIGGTVILHTRRPLDQEANTGFFSAEGTWADTTKKTDGQFSGSYSWHDEDDRFGVFVGYTQQKRHARTMGADTESWQWYGRDEGGTAVDVNGQPSKFNSNWWGGTGFYDQNGHYYTGFMMPTSVNFSVKDEERERKGGQVTLQFKPTDNLTLTANYFRFDLSQNSQTNTLKIPEWNIARYYGDGNWPGGRLLDGLTMDPSGTIVTGANYSLHPGKAYYCSEEQAAAAGKAGGGWGSDDCTVPTPQVTGSYNLEKARSQTFDFGGEWRGESVDVAFKVGRTWAKGGPSLQFSLPIKPRSQNADGSWNLGNTASAWDLTGTPSMTFAPNLLQNLQSGILQVDLGSTGSSWTRNSVQQKFAQIDTTWHTDGGFLDSIQFGVKGRDGGIHRSTGNSYWVCPGTDPSDYKNRFWNGGCNVLASQFSPSLIQSIGNLTGAINASAFPAINFPGYIGYLNDTYGEMQTRQEPNFVYNVDEKIYSSYLQANFRTDRLRGNLGVRMVSTKQHADSTDKVTYYNDYFFDGADGNPLPCQFGGNQPVPAGAPAGTSCGSEGYWKLSEDYGRPESFAVSQVNRTYRDFLPSFNLAYDLTDNLVLRAAASKVISRPSYGDIASPGSLQYYSQEYVNDRRLTGGAGDLGWFGSGSNKNLQPYKANQYDLGLEWYFHPGSVVGLGLFKKDVSNFTVPVIQDVQMVIGGQTVTVQNYSTTAGGRDGESKGVEFYAQHTLDFGLGFQLNYTYNKTNEAAITLADGTDIGESPLVGSAKNQANFTVFYETDALLLRASYNRRGEVVDGQVNGLNVYEEPYQQIDLNAAYNFTPALSLTASILNLTKEETRSHLGNDTKDRFYSNGYAGRIAYLGLTYKF